MVQWVSARSLEDYTVAYLRYGSSPACGEEEQTRKEILAGNGRAQELHPAERREKPGPKGSPLFLWGVFFCKNVLSFQGLWIRIVGLIVEFSFGVEVHGFESYQDSFFFKFNLTYLATPTSIESKSYAVFRVLSRPQ